jgi:chromosome segregation ATPase
MNKYTFLITLLSALLVFSCNLEEMEKLDQENEELNSQLDERDSSITLMLSSFNEIQENLNEIKRREGVIKINSADEVEGEGDVADNILADIETINSLMKENEVLIEKLQSQLKQAQRQAGESDRKMQEFRKLINSLNQQIDFKNQEIAELNQVLESKNQELGVLYFKVDSLNFSNKQKEETIEQQVDEMNVAYYAYGTYKELKEKNVLTKEGGFLGLGKEEQLKNNFNRDYFSKIDIRKQKSFLIYADNAELITTHPKNSYEFKGDDDKIDSLIIKDPKAFWEASRYLVIVID